MIVIVIIGVVYTLAITKLQNYGEEKAAPNFYNLKEYLLSYIKDDASKAKLLCLDDCSECSVYVDDEKVETFESFFDDSVESYRYDFLQGAVEKQEDVFFNEEGVQESVCFSFNVSKNLVADQIIVLYEDKAYDYSAYFTNTLVYDTLEEAVEKKQDLAEEVIR